MADIKSNGGRVWLVVGAAALGAVMFFLGQASASKARAGSRGKAEMPELSVWQRKVHLGGKEVMVEGGSKSSQHASGLVAYRMRGVPALLQWEEAGRYPVLDVPRDWVVAWLDGGQVVAVSNPSAAGEGDRNVVFPAKPVEGALVLPGSFGAKVGDRFTE